VTSPSGVQLAEAHERQGYVGRGGADHACELLRSDAGQADRGLRQNGCGEHWVFRERPHHRRNLGTKVQAGRGDLGSVLDGRPGDRYGFTDGRRTELNGLHVRGSKGPKPSTTASTSAVPRSMSPVAVYGYHTCLFSLAAPKLSCLTAFLSNESAVPEVFESIRCEAYGPSGAALIVDCRTDSRDRTIARVRQVVLAHGGLPGARGAVSYLFNEVGRLVFAPGADAGRLTGVAVQAGAEDVVPAGGASVLAGSVDRSDRFRDCARGVAGRRIRSDQRASDLPRFDNGSTRWGGGVAMLHLIEASKT